MWSRIRGRRAAQAAGFVGFAVLTACGGGGDGGPSGTPGSISVAVNPASLSLQQGASGTVTVTLTRGGGFSGTVSVSISGLPTGVTTSISPDQLSGATTSATVTVNVAASVAPGTYTASVRAAATGVGEATTSYTLTVTAAPNYALAVTPATLSIAQGATGTANVAITRTAFTGAVDFSLQGAPAGVTGSFAPASTTADASVLTVAVAGSTAPGSYTLTVQGIATGPGVKTASLALTVTAGAGYALSVAPASISLAPGASGSATVNIDRTNFTGAVTLGLDSPPAGISATFVPASSTTNTSAMTVNVAANVAGGTYTVTVRGTAAGLADRTAQFSVVVAAPAFTLALAPTALTMQQGGSGTTTVTIGRTNFAGAVALSLDTPPAGISGTFAPGSTTGTTSTLTINAAGNTPTGAYTLTVRGTASGITDRTVQLALTVTAAPGSISIALNPSSVSVQQGASGSSTVNITRTNFAGDVTLTSSGAPGAVTVAFNPSPTTSSTSTATVNVGSGTPAGTYPIIVTASGTGVTAATATLQLTVTTPGSGGNAEWQFCSSSDTPVFFAYQDGTAAWQRVTPSTIGSVTKFAFNLSAGRGGVAYVTQETSARVAADASAVSSRSRLAQGRALLERRQQQLRGTQPTYSSVGLATTYSTEVIYGTATELTTLGTDNCNDTQPTKTITGTVAGVGVGQVATLSLGGGGTTYIGGTNPNVTFRNVATGTVDFVGTRSTLGAPPELVVLFRDLNIPDGGAMPSIIDFAGSGAFAPATATATLANTLGEELFLGGDLTTSNGETLSFFSDFTGGTNPQRTWAGLPANRTVSGDVFGIFAFATPANSQSSDARAVFQYVASVTNQTLTFGPNLTEPTATPLAVGAYPRFRFQGNLPTEYRQAVSLAIQNSASGGNDVTISATGGYLAAVGSNSVYDLSMPDIAGLNGFPAASRLASGANELNTSAFGWSGVGITTPRPRAGDQFRIATRSKSISVP